jgi:hypothetical protein
VCPTLERVRLTFEGGGFLQHPSVNVGDVPARVAFVRMLHKGAAVVFNTSPYICQPAPPRGAWQLWRVSVLEAVLVAPFDDLLTALVAVVQLKKCAAAQHGAGWSFGAVTAT